MVEDDPAKRCRVFLLLLLFFAASVAVFTVAVLVTIVATAIIVSFVVIVDPRRYRRAALARGVDCVVRVATFVRG